MLLPRVAVVEDDILLARAVEVALQDEGYDVRKEVGTLATAELMEGFRPDLAILGVRLPADCDSPTLDQSVRQFGGLPLIWIGAADSLPDRVAVLEAGADDYLGKPFSMAELLLRVRAILRRSGRVPSSTRRVADLVIDDYSHTVTRSGVPLLLTGMEYQLLRTLACRPHSVLSKSQLLSEVWGFAGFDPNVVEVHMSALRRKLEAHGPRVLHTVRGVGYVLRA